MQIELFKDATVWTKPNCIACEQVKSILKDNGYNIDLKDVEEGPNMMELIKFNPYAKSVPQVVINGRYIGGLRQVKEYLTRK